MKHSITHLEIPVTKMARAKKFYGKLFAWKFETIDKDYIVFRPAQGVGGALRTVKKVSTGESMTPYFEVVSLEKTLAVAKKLKAKVIVHYMDIGKYGFMAQIKDSEGNTIGLHQC